MAGSDDLVNFVLRFGVQVFTDGRVVDKRNGIFGICLGQAKQVAHGFDGDEDAGVGAVIAVAANFIDHADDVETDSVEKNRGTHGRTSGEHVLEHFPSHDGHAAALGVVFIVEPAAGTDGHVANLVVIGGHAEDLAVGRAVVADGADVFTIQHWRQSADELRLLANGGIIGIGKVISLPGLCAALDCRDASGKHEHYVLSQGPELSFLAAAETFSQTYQKQQRAYAPGDSEHGEEGAQLVRP